MEYQVPTPFLAPPTLPRTAYAQSFNGTSQYSSSGYLLTLSPYKRISVGCWLNWTTFANNDALALEYGPDYVTTGVGGFIFDPNSSSPDSGKFDVGFATGAFSETTAGFIRPSAGVWHHIMAMFNAGVSGAGQIPAVYVDGAPQSLTYGATAGVAGNFGNQTLYLMSRAGSTLFGAGAMANLTIYTDLLEPADVQALASGVDPRLVGNGTLSHFWTLSTLGPEPNLAWNRHTAQIIPSTTSAVAGPQRLVNQNIRNPALLMTQIVGMTRTTVIVNAAMPLEWTAGQRADSSLPAEWTASVAADAKMPLEWTGGMLRADAVLPLEWTGGVLKSDALLPLEWNNAVVTDSKLPLDWPGWLVGNSKLPLEWTGGIVKSDAGLPLEWTNTVAMGASAPIEWLLEVASVLPLPIESTQPVPPTDLGWDVLGAIEEACPGLVITRDMLSAVLLEYQANGYRPLSSAQILAIVHPLIPEGDPPQYTLDAPPGMSPIMPGASPLFPPTCPPFPTLLPRFEDSNPDPLDGWAIDDPGYYDDP